MMSVITRVQITERSGLSVLCRYCCIMGKEAGKIGEKMECQGKPTSLPWSLNAIENIKPTHNCSDKRG